MKRIVWVSASIISLLLLISCWIFVITPITKNELQEKLLLCERGEYTPNKKLSTLYTTTPVEMIRVRSTAESCVAQFKYENTPMQRGAYQIECNEYQCKTIRLNYQQYSNQEIFDVCCQFTINDSVRR